MGHRDDQLFRMIAEAPLIGLPMADEQLSIHYVQSSKVAYFLTGNGQCHKASKEKTKDL